jgi:DNA-binding SARP family transcriptional activator
VDWDWRACPSWPTCCWRAAPGWAAPPFAGVRSGGLRQQDVADLAGLSLRRYAIHIRPHEKALLGILPLHAGTPCSADILLEDVRGDNQPTDPGGTLRLVVSRIRQALQPERLITRAGCGAYRADPPPGALNRHRFDALLADASRVAAMRQSEREARRLEAAMAAWTHPEIGFPEVPDSLRMLEKTERLREQRRIAEIRLANLHLALGQHEAALPAQYATDPGSERRCAQLMQALIKAGRRAEALDAYQQCAKVLAEEYGTHPGDDLQALLTTALGGQ